MNIRKKNLETQKSLEQLVTIISLAAQGGDEVALKVMDEVQTILTTDWEDIPQDLKDQMALVTARMLFESEETENIKNKETIEG